MAIETPEYSRRLQELEHERAVRLAGNRPARLPLRLERDGEPALLPLPADHPICPIDAVELKFTGKGNGRQCPACGRTEYALLQRGLNLYPVSSCNKPDGLDAGQARLMARAAEAQAARAAEDQAKREAEERDRQEAVTRVLTKIHEPLLKGTLTVAREPRQVPQALDAITTSKGRKWDRSMLTSRPD